MWCVGLFVVNSSLRHLATDTPSPTNQSTPTHRTALHSFDEMVDHMKAVAQQPQELSVEERNLLSVAYKNVIGSRRASWRVISSIEQKGEQERLPLIREYKAKIEDELLEICNDILSIIETELIPNSTSEEGKVRRCLRMPRACTVVSSRISFIQFNPPPQPPNPSTRCSTSR